MGIVILVALIIQNSMCEANLIYQYTKITPFIVPCRPISFHLFMLGFKVTSYVCHEPHS